MRVSITLFLTGTLTGRTESWQPVTLPFVRCFFVYSQLFTPFQAVGFTFVTSIVSGSAPPTEHQTQRKKDDEPFDR